jgi:branched-chain amino acid transport system substrate-binding protein
MYGTITQYSQAVTDVIKKLRDSGQIGNKIAMVNIADEYGIESANVSRKLLPAAGFQIVYDKSYPLGTQDYAPVIKAAKGTNPDAFIAYSYPPDTFGLTDQAKIENFNGSRRRCPRESARIQRMGACVNPGAHRGGPCRRRLLNLAR